MVSAISFGAMPPRARYISENLIIGPKQGISSLRQLRDEEYIGQVIDLRNGRYLRRLREFLVCKFLGIKYRSCPMTIGDRAPLQPEKFEQIHSIINENHNGRTYLHCNSGVHRSLLVGAFEKIKSGEIKSFGDLAEFLKNGRYFDLRKKVRFGVKVPLSPVDIRYRTENLRYQMQSFWNMVNK